MFAVRARSLPAGVPEWNWLPSPEGKPKPPQQARDDLSLAQVCIM
jgi:hypothetical protein